MKFQIRNKTFLEVCPNAYPDNYDSINVLSQYSYDVTIMDETETAYVISNSENIKIDFPKNIVVENQLNIIDGKLKLTESLFKHWFGKKNELITSAIYNLVVDNLRIIIENKQIIFENSNFFLIYVPYFFYAYSNAICLGAWLESFEDLEFEVSNVKPLKLVIASIVGSPLSGMNSCSGWSIEQQKLIRGKSTRHYHKIRKKYQEISAMYNNVPNSSIFQIIILAKELGIEIPKELSDL